LKTKLLEKLEDYLVKFQNESIAFDSSSTEPFKAEKLPGSVPSESTIANIDSVTFFFFFFFFSIISLSP